MLWRNIRIGILLVFFVAVLFDSRNTEMSLQMVGILSVIAALFGVFFSVTMGMFQLHSMWRGEILTAPTWGSSPFDRRTPMQVLFFMSKFFIVCGIASICASGFALDSEGVVGVILGLSIGLGVRLVRKRYSKKYDGGEARRVILAEVQNKNR